MKRNTAAGLGRDTVKILDQGFYTNTDGETVEITDTLRRAVHGTCSYPPGTNLPVVAAGPRQTQIDVTNESTLAAARRLAEGGLRPAALNFASAKHAGGGFLGGAQAQEESLARSSGLFACLVGNPMYAFHKAQGDPLYSDYALYSPDVPVFRDDEGTLLPRPYLCSFITSPAVNAQVVLERDRGRRRQIRQAMADRIEKVLTVASLHGHEALVLGAWGCGVFGNDSREVAELFERALATGFRGVFTRIVFAILDWSDERRFIGPFQALFGQGQGE